MENHLLTLAPGEKVVRKCSYMHQRGKKYENTHFLTLTNKRLIESSVEDYKSATSLTSNAIPLEDIDSVKSFFTIRKRRLHPIFIVLFLVLMIFSIGTFVAEATIPGIVLLVVAVVVLAVGILLRKKECQFAIDIGRISYQSTSEHLQLGYFGSKNQNKRGAKKFLAMHGRKLLYKGVGIMVIIGTLIYLITTISGGSYSTGVIYAIIIMLFGIVLLTSRNFSSGKKGGSAQFIPNLKTEINVDSVRAVIDELGALIYDLRQQNELPDNLSNTTNNQISEE